MVRLLVFTIALATVLPVLGEVRHIAQQVSNAAVFLLFLFHGLRLPRGDVLAGLGNHRLLIPLTIWVFGAMTTAGWLLWQGSAIFVPATIAIGFLYLGVLPSTVQAATVYSSLAGGNVASSVVAAALLNIVGVFVSAPLFSLIAGSNGVAFHGDTLIKILTNLLLPFVLGQVLQGSVREWVARHRHRIIFVDRGSIAIAVYVAFSGAVEQHIWSQVDAQVMAALVVACGALLAFGYGGAWLLGGALHLSRGDRITMLFSGAQKSIAMGAPLATVIFPPAKAGIIMLPLLVYHLSQMVVAAPIAARLKSADG